jgi:hypothetical protein
MSSSRTSAFLVALSSTIRSLLIIFSMLKAIGEAKPLRIPSRSGGALAELFCRGDEDGGSTTGFLGGSEIIRRVREMRRTFNEQMEEK